MTSMFGHNIRSELVLLYLSECLMVFLAVYALLAIGTSAEYPVNHVRAMLVAATLALCSGVVCGASGLYQPALVSGQQRMLTGCALAGVLLLLATWLVLRIAYPAGRPTLPPNLLPELLLSCLGAVALTRVTFLLLLRRGLLRRRILLLEPAEGAANDSNEVFSIAMLPTGQDAAALLREPRQLRAQRIWAVVAPPQLLDEQTRQACAKAGIRLLSVAEFHECRHNRVACDLLAPDWLQAVRARPEGLAAAALRRAFDITVSLTLLLITLPVMIATAIIIKLDSPGPIFYRQERVGLHGRVFTLTKFRSMRTDAEAAGKPQWASRQDSRVTRVGRFIRLTRIDELPQILNVLRGDMAFVGPRPERPAFVEELGRIIPRYHDRACVKPGITGWAQVNYPYGASVEDARMKLAYDLYYVRRRSLFLDLLILVATIRVVLLQEGAR